jgi:NADH-quinone oxidoreductase subunit A
MIATWPLGLYTALVIALACAMLAASHVLGQRHREPGTDKPYESGAAPTGGAQLRFAVGFYVVAVAFVVFDLEAVFLFAWAVAASELAWAGYVEAMIFIGTLISALLYLWRRHALEWGPSARHTAPETI